MDKPKKKRTEAMYKALHKYDKKTYKKLGFRVRYDDKEVLKKLESVPSVSAYVVELIRKDIEASKS